jgi:rod shape determining protein RodA
MKLTEHKYMRNFDWALFGSVGIILLIGLLNLYSATYGLTLSKYFIDQIVWILGGVVVMFLVSLIDYHFFNRYAYLMYGLTMVMLILVFFIGRSAGGSQRWIHLGFFNVQPSEIIKISVVLALARYFQDHQEKRTMGIWDLFIPMLLTIPPFILVLKQPDLGTSLIVLSAAILMIWFIGVQRRILVVTVLLALISMPIIWKFGLHDYQRDRVISFLDPEKYASGKGYQVTQAKIAIGSGRFSGKGYLNGSQSKLQFLPKQHTDFVYSNFGEEFGFLGSVFLFGLYIVFFLACFNIAVTARDVFGVLVAFGFSATLICQTLINFGMEMGILPVVGITLPFLSYGGTSIIGSMLKLGILLNISRRKIT